MVRNGVSLAFAAGFSQYASVVMRRLLSVMDLSGGAVAASTFHVIMPAFVTAMVFEGLTVQPRQLPWMDFAKVLMIWPFVASCGNPFITNTWRSPEGPSPVLGSQTPLG